MVRNIIIFIILATGLFAVLLYARPAAQTENLAAVSILQSERGDLSAERLQHDFGTISMKNGIVRTTFEIKNIGSEKVVLRKLYTSCMCTEATLIIGASREGPFGMPGHVSIETFNQEFNPNESAKIEVSFDPNAHGPAGVGKMERQILLEGVRGVLMTLNISSVVTP